MAEVKSALIDHMTLDDDGSFLLDITDEMESITIPDFSFCPTSMCGHEICQMRNLSISHSESLAEYISDYDSWYSAYYITMEHVFDPEGDHKQIWNFNHKEITEGLKIGVKYRFNSGFKDYEYGTYHFEFPFNLRMCPAYECLWEKTETNTAQVIVEDTGYGEVDLVNYDPEIAGSCPINYKITKTIWGVRVNVDGSMVSVSMNIVWMRASDGSTGMVSMTAGNCLGQLKNMNVEYVVRLCTELDAKEHNPEK